VRQIDITDEAVRDLQELLKAVVAEWREGTCWDEPLAALFP
jgi:hypothetical protein